MALTDKLTAIADAVRAKTGGTELLTLDEIAAAISGISGGGGLPSAVATVTYGEYIPTVDTNTMPEIAHGLGAVPDITAAWCGELDCSEYSTTTLIGSVIIRGITTRISSSAVSDNANICLTKATGDSSVRVGSPSSTAYVGTLTESVFPLQKTASAVYIRSGVTYHWIAVKLREDV